MRCPSCGVDAPPGTYCVQCGSLLTRAERRFGANPRERAGVPALVSTLFPALPRAGMSAFRVVLAGGAVLVAVLTLTGLFPLALTAAILLVPILTALYLWDVDVYEDQPWKVVGLTIGVGAATGIALGLASQLVQPGTGEQADALLVGGFVLPVAALLFALAGPTFLLLPRDRFNDLLDGATFGAVSAASLTAAMAMTRGASLLTDGLQPQGDTSEWLLRLAGLGLAQPVLAMCAAGGAAAALWVRYRAPVPDASALGPLARPRFAVPLAVALVVAGAGTQVLLPVLLWLPLIVVLDVIALLWLRNVIHQGLRQQAAEREIGPPEPCKECGASTPVHTYCASCGTARSALPKGAGHRRWPLVAVPAAVLALGLGVATAGAAIVEPEPLEPPCLRGLACGKPPSPPDPLVFEEEVDGGELGWTGAYDPRAFDLHDPGPGGYDLVGKRDQGANVDVRVRVERGAQVEEMLDAERDRLDDEVFSLVDDDDPERRIAGPMIGYRHAQVRLLSGTVELPQGLDTGFTAAVLAATDGTRTVTVTVSATAENADYRRAVFSYADVVLQGFRWGADGTVRASLLLKPRRERALDARAAGRGRPLSAAEQGRRFGPGDRALARVRAAARAAGLRPGPVLPQRTAMPVSGPARAIERAFGVKLLAAVGGRHRPDRPATVPAAMRAHVSGVTGLDTRPVARPAAFPASGLRPVDARRVYGMEELERRGKLGQGETIAVLSLDSFDEADIAAYDQLVGVDSGPVERVPVNGGTRMGPDAEEVHLDLDVIRGLAPRAKLLNYEAPNREGAFADIMDRIVADGRARIVSISWGRCELTLPTAERERDAAAFRAAAAAGIAVFVASGDQGAYECERFDSADQRLSVSWPAASRHVVAVGGTSLRMTEDRRRDEEAGWESPFSNKGAGGGVAGSEPAPPWQLRARVPRLLNRLSDGHRQVPDVAAAGDFRTGWLMVIHGKSKMVGGTSAAAPFWAAAAALVNETLRDADRPRPRSFASMLYEVAARRGSRAFYDVTFGGNRYHDAGPGWDYVTGLGTPHVGRLAAAAVAASAR